MNLNGTWLIKINAWWGIFFWHNKKIIEGDSGYNVAWFNKIPILKWFWDKWGNFSIAPSCESLSHFIFIYDNGKIIDKVQWRDKDNLRGNFYWNEEFKATFTMERVVKKWQFVWSRRFRFGKGVYPESANIDESRLLFRYWHIGFLEVRRFSELEEGKINDRKATEE